jgi:hypothetical protein
MSGSLELVLLKCPQCGTPVPAEEDEIAWTCATCGQGWQLTADGLAPQVVRWMAAAPNARPESWRPMWIFAAQVSFAQRDTWQRATQPDKLWQQPVRFYVPAYPCALAQMQKLGAELTRKQVVLPAGPAQGPLKGVTLLPSDAVAAAEFIVLTIEAERNDKLKSVNFTINFGPPDLWVLPYKGDWPILP